MSIWDTIKVNDDLPQEPSNNGGSFTLQYGTEFVEVPVSKGLTLQQAIDQYAANLGYAQGRAVTFRLGQNVVSGSTLGEASAKYMASVQLETKGC